MKSNHLRSRLLAAMLWTLGTIFLLVAVCFNIFLSIYIRSSVEDQLDSLTFRDHHHGGSHGRDASVEMWSAEGELPDLSGQKTSRVNTTGHVFVIDLFYNVVSAESATEGAAVDIAEELEKQKIDPAALDNYSLRTDQGRYYLSTVSDAQGRNQCTVFFVDMTVLKNFSDVINIALCVILALTVLLAFLFSRRIARRVDNAVERLGNYAAGIGEGQFHISMPRFDVLELQQLSEELHRTAEKLETSQKKQEAFFQNASHELRTPLMSIRCYAEGITCNVMPVKESADTILAETDRLSEMVERLLYISRLDGEKEPQNTGELDLREIASLCASRMRGLAEKQGIEFEFDFDTDAVSFVCCQRDMEQLFGNLISNALRYAQSRITVSCRRGSGSVDILVRDDGKGIQEDLLPCVFERFSMGGDGRHGIGLSIVRTVAELYGGTAEAFNDNGAVFCVTLPQ